MNPTTVQIIIGAATFLFTVFSAIYLNHRHVDRLMEIQNKRLDDLNRHLDSKIEGLEKRMELRFDNIDFRLNNLEQRLARVEDILFKPTLAR